MKLRNLALVPAINHWFVASSRELDYNRGHKEARVDPEDSEEDSEEVSEDIMNFSDSEIDDV